MFSLVLPKRIIYMRYGFSTLNHYNFKLCVESIEHLKKCKRYVELFQLGYRKVEVRFK